MVLRRLSLAAALLVPILMPVAAHAAPNALALGFSADAHLTGGTASSAPWINRAASVGADVVRVNIHWSQVAPRTRAAGFHPSDPSSQGYRWTSTDAPIRGLSAAGFKILITVLDAPRWAEGRNPPRTVGTGTWQPSATQLAQFATALARRYSGRYPDPANPLTVLPRVRYWQGWNEPNLDYYLSPQWSCTHGRCKTIAPSRYREMENGFYRGVKRVDPSNFVVLAGTGPYGDAIGSVPLGKERIPPLAFYRALLSRPVYLDALDHHPYGVGGPHWHALNADDIAVPDVHKIADVLHAAQRGDRVLPRGPKAIWVTEIGWSSKPPNPEAVPVEQDARWIEQAFYVLWRQGVDTALLLEIGDPPPIRNYQSVFESGIYYANGYPKPGAIAFRFPFITQRLGGDRVEAWGRAPGSGQVRIERLDRGRWRTIHALRVRTRQLFDLVISMRGRAVLRAQLESATSLVWTQGP